MFTPAHTRVIRIFNEIRALDALPVDAASAARALDLFRNARSLARDNPDDTLCLELLPRLNHLIAETEMILTEFQGA